MPHWLQVKKPVDAGVKEALRALRAAALSESGPHPDGTDGAGGLQIKGTVHIYLSMWC